MNLQHGGHMSFGGNLGLAVIRKPTGRKLAQPLSWQHILRDAFPLRSLSPDIRLWRAENLPIFLRGLVPWLRARYSGALFLQPALYLAVIRDGQLRDYGLVSLRVITDAGVNYLVDAFQNTTELENLKYHAIGTGTNAEAVGNTALQTELTTQYNPDNTRATGSTTEGASANIYRTVGTNTVDAPVAITEHGILSQAAVGGGTLWDRSVFSAVNLSSGDSLQSTYDLTCTSGG